MKSITISLGKVKALLSENALIDTATWRVKHDFPDLLTAREFDYYRDKDNENHFYKELRMGGATFSIDLYRNQWREFADIQFSLAKLLRDGTNLRGFKRPIDFENTLRYKLMGLQQWLKERTGIENLSFKESPFRRVDFAVNLRLQNNSEAKWARDYLYDNEIPHFLQNPNVTSDCPDPDAKYFNNRACVESFQPDDEEGNEEAKRKAPERGFAIYTVNNILRLEPRYYTLDSIRALTESGLGKQLQLENNLPSFCKVAVMNRIFFDTARHLFLPAEQEKIRTAFGLPV
jgi:hypothetical protein